MTEAPAPFVLVHGPKSDPWFWHRVVPGLEAGGHTVTAVDLPVGDDGCGMVEYARTIVDAAASPQPAIVVSHSWSAFVTALLPDVMPVAMLVLTAPMTPGPGEPASDWWVNTAHREAYQASAVEAGRSPAWPFDFAEVYLHDVPPALLDEFAAHYRDQSMWPLTEPWPLERWPEVPTRSVVGRHDRLFPLEFQRRVLHDRLGIEPEIIESGHLGALAAPNELTEVLLGLAAAVPAWS